MTHTKKILAIQSVADIITNSSSEVFVIHTNKFWNEVENIMHSWKLGDTGSGMGGCIEVYDSKRPYIDQKYLEEYMRDKPYYPWLPDDHLLVHIDWGLAKHIDKMFEEFEVVDSEEVDLIYNKKTGKLYRMNKDIRERGLSEDEELFTGGTRMINKARIDWATKERKDLEKRIKKEFGGLENAKAYFEIYKDYLETGYEIDNCKISERDSKRWAKASNKKLHEKYKKNNEEDTNPVNK